MDNMNKDKAGFLNLPFVLPFQFLRKEDIAGEEYIGLVNRLL